MTMNRQRAREKASALVERMSVEEMISQLRYDAPAIERLNIPAYNWWNEGLHGVARAGTATVFPQAIGLAATWDDELIEEIGDVIAQEARAKYNASSKYGDRDIYKGLTLWCPNVNIFRDPRWGRGHETFGEDPYLTGRFGKAMVRGLQGEGEYLKVAACAKHFAVHSGPEELRHCFNAKVSDKDLYETYLPAFKACVEAGVEAVMGAYNRTNDEACCASPRLMQKILREEWGFEGHYVSDCWAIRDFHEHHGLTNTPVESAALAINSGCDLNCGVTYLCLKEAYEKNKVKKSAIMEAAVRLFTTRFMLGLFESEEGKNPFDEIPYTEVACNSHRNLSLTAAMESIVLLKNDGILPLKKEGIKTLGIIGPNADSRNALIGNYHGTASGYQTALEGVRDYVGEEIRILYSQGCHLFADKEEALALADDRISEAKAVCEHSDLILLCVGLDERLEGEEGDTGNAYSSGDKKDLSFPPGQIRLMEAVFSMKKPVVFCNFAGSAMDLSLAEEKAAAILQMWYPGERGGEALAKILFGEVSPSGKLPVTFYRDVKELPAFTDYSMEGRTYRYLRSEPLYPFGFGLGYGDVRVTGATLMEELSPTSSTAKKREEPVKEIQILVEAVNESPLPVKEVLQVYIRNEDSAFAPPHPVLCRFQKISFAPGEKKEILLSIPSEARLVVNEKGERIFDTEKSRLFINVCGADAKSRALSGKEGVELLLSRQ